MKRTIRWIICKMIFMHDFAATAGQLYSLVRAVYWASFLVTHTLSDLAEEELWADKGRETK